MIAVSYTNYDALIVFAWLLCLGETYSICKFVKIAYIGYHVVDIPPPTNHDITLGATYNYANQLLYYPILCIIKAAVIIFLLRIGEIRKTIKVSLQALFIVNLAMLIAFWTVDLFQCNPLSYFYNSINMDIAAQIAAGADENGMVDGKVVKGGKCINELRFYLASGVLTIVTDILVLVIPMAMVWGLRMSLHKKIAVITVLSIGWIATAVGIVRIYVVQVIFNPRNKDPTYNVGIAISAIEVNLALIAACAPAFRALTKQWLPRVWSANYSTPANFYNTADAFGNIHSTPASGSHLRAGAAVYNGDQISMAEAGYKQRRNNGLGLDSDSQEEIMADAAKNGIMAKSEIEMGDIGGGRAGRAGIV